MALQTVLQTTDDVGPARAFDFWRSTVLAPFGDIGRLNPRQDFAARRIAAVSHHGALTHTRSSPVAVAIRPHHLDGTGSDTIVIGLPLSGVGYQEQANLGTRLSAGDISFLSRDRPYVAGSQSEYEEIRLAVPRAAFERSVGDAEAIIGRCLVASPANREFAAHVKLFARSVAHMSDAQAGVAFEGALHLLRGLVQGKGAQNGCDVSKDALRALARGSIERRLHEPNLSPDGIRSALGVSRAQLYRAFADCGGVAAAIRDARLDLAHRHLSSPNSDGLMVSTIMYACGFDDAATFSRAFRRRFGLSPRDMRALRTSEPHDLAHPSVRGGPGAEQIPWGTGARPGQSPDRVSQSR